MSLLKDRYGGKLGVLHAHKLKILCGQEVRDSIDAFSKISNKLGCFKTVIEIYYTDSSFF